jgi:hypothetical protein
MAETRLTNIIEPRIFNEYTIEPSIRRSRLFLSGAMVQSAEISQYLGGAGKLYNLPFWNDTVGGTGSVPSETVAVTPDAVTSGEQVFRKQFREKVWGTNSLVTSIAGSSPLEAAASRVNDFWAQVYDSLGVKSIQGIVADDIANDSGSIVNDISGGAGALSNFTDAAVITAQLKLGENGAVRVDGQGVFSSIVVHPDVYGYMRRLDLIAFVPTSTQERTIEQYLGMEVIVTVNAPKNVDVYDTYMLKPGSLLYGVTEMGYIPTEIDRRPNIGFGVDDLYTRRTFGIHPMGYAWLEGSVAGTSPTDAELINAANWDKAYDVEVTGIVCLRHKIDQS